MIYELNNALIAQYISRVFCPKIAKLAILNPHNLTQKLNKKNKIVCPKLSAREQYILDD